MTRCATTIPDGRRCCAPVHEEEGKHLVAKSPLTPEAATKIAEAWGWKGRLAAVVTHAAASGTMPADRFVAILEAGGLVGAK